MAFDDTYRESIQSKHLGNVGFTSTAKRTSNEANSVINPHQILSTQIPVIDVVGTYGITTDSGIAAGQVEEHIVQLTSDPSVNGNKAWLAYETDCTTSGHSGRGAVRLDQWMRYPETEYKARIFADNGGIDMSSQIFHSETAFDWEYDPSAGVVYFDDDPTSLGFTGPLWAIFYTYIGEVLYDKIDSTSSGGGSAFKYMTDGNETAEATSSTDTFNFNSAGNITVSVDGTSKTVTISGAGVSSFSEDNMTLNGSVWEYDGDFGSVPSDLIVYYNGVKNKGSDSDYYTTAVVSGVLQVDFAFETYSDDWVNIEWDTVYDVAQGEKAWITKTAAYTALKGDRIIVDTTAVSTYTIKLPGNPSTGDMVSFFDGGGNCQAVNVIIGRNGKNIMGLAQDLSIDTDDASFELVYYTPAGGWRIVE